MRLAAEQGGTRVDYDYSVEISGKVAAVGGRMLEGAARMVIGQFFEHLVPSGPQFSGQGIRSGDWFPGRHLFEHRYPCCRTKRRAIKRALVHHPAKAIVLRISRHIEEFHHIRPPHHSPPWHAASNDLGEAREIRIQPVETLRPAGTVTKSRNDFVKNKQLLALTS